MGTDKRRYGGASVFICDHLWLFSESLSPEKIGFRIARQRKAFLCVFASVTA